MKTDDTVRYESDSMGKVAIPSWAYWGAQTQRAIANFTVSDKRIPPSMIRALALIKKHAARTNAKLKIIDASIADAIVSAAEELHAGKWDAHFPLDVFQTGSGTSWNMNTNEVLANRANELLGSPLGSKNPVHPNDHVNRCQSSNDSIPTALHIANRLVAAELYEALQVLEKSLRQKEKEFTDLLKLGRTHLQDAVPMTLGQEFSGFAMQIRKAQKRLACCYSSLEELALGGTALGTGVNAAAGYQERTIAGIAKETNIPFRPAENLFEAIAARDAQVELMGVLNGIATALMKIANDLRLLASGPRGGLGEITLPSLQPGSSIMPGKVNPVIPEMVIQVAAHVNGKAVAVTIAGQNSPLELNMMHPLIAHETIESMEILRKTCHSLASKCIDGITADVERLQYWIEWSLALVTPLAVEIGYDEATRIAYRAYKEKRKVRDVLYEEGVLTHEKIDQILDPASMVGGNHK